MLPQTEHLRTGHVVRSFNAFRCDCYFKVSTNMVLSGSIWSLLSIAFIDLFPQIVHIHIKEYQQSRRMYNTFLMKDALINA